MVLRCLTWIPELWAQLIYAPNRKDCTNEQLPDLPDDAVFEILTRLPPGAVVKCGKLCKEWLALTSTPYFVDMHHQRTSSLLVHVSVLGQPKPSEVKLLLLEDDSLKFKTIRAGWISMKDNNLLPELVGCCNTKLVFMASVHPIRYHICCLLKRGKVILEPPKPSSIFFAIFFHPRAREYRLLFFSRAKTNREYEVLVYSCGSKTWRELPIISYQPTAFHNQVTLKGNLYWIAVTSIDFGDISHSCINSIIGFNTATEKFRSMPHPGRECKRRSDQYCMRMLEMEGLLCFGNVEGNFIRIWVLEDYENWSWTLRYTVDLNWDGRRFPSTTFESSMIRLWSIKRGKLMISWFSRGLFRYHLEHNIIEKIDGLPKYGHCRGFLVTLDLSC